MVHISQILAKFPKSIPPTNGEENPVTQTMDESLLRNLNSKDDNEPQEGSKEWVASKLRQFNISSLDHTFESFKPINNETATAKKTLQAISEGKMVRQFILLSGTTGCGKTHLIEATIINWAKHGLRSYYMTFSDIARMLKRELHKGSEFYDLQFQSYRDTNRLIVDDFGAGTTESRFEISDLEDIIDLRYRKRYYPDCDLVTILATNKDIKDLPDRVVSRFYDPEFGVVLYMGDKDYRRRAIK